ncbi:MAG: hypothetical protein KJO31_07785 [Gammaproteobacteria bacterium]|nr:hypothetical protein [Gammaproteobacteria bacterium]
MIGRSKPAKFILAAFGVAIVLYLAWIYFSDRFLPQTGYDVAIVERTIELLDDAGNWNRNDDRTCGPDKTGLSLYCALQRASIEVAGEFQHRAASLQQIRFAIERQHPQADYEHRLMDYNNDPQTSFEELHEMLRDALTRLRQSESAADQADSRASANSR